MMPKNDTIAAIMDLNPTVSPRFLAEFPNDDLWEYLHRLEGVNREREVCDVTPVEMSDLADCHLAIPQP